MKTVSRIVVGSIATLVGMQSYAIEIPSNINNIAAEITSVTNPGLVQKRLEETTPRAPRSVAGVLETQEKSSQPTSEEQKIHFTLTRVIIKGNTIFKTEELEDIFKPYYGKNISLADFQNKVNEITTKYRAAGYVLSRAILPAQSIKNGVVQVQVIEGFISNITVTADSVWTKKIIKQYSENVLASRPLQVHLLERDLLLMNDLPGMNVKAVITPSKTVSAAADLTLVTQKQNINAYMSYDNYGSRYLGPQEFGVGVSVNGATTPGSSDSISYLTLPDVNQLQYVAFNHMNPLGSKGLKMNVSYSYTYTLSGFVLAPLNVRGYNKLLYADFSYPMIRSRTENFYIHTTANYQSVYSTILEQPFYNDLLRTLVIGGDYNNVDRWRGMNDVRLDIEKGFDIFGATQHLNQSRPNGVPNFLKGSLWLSRLQALPWQLSILGAMYGQYAFQPLLVTEQYAYGGSQWGRGYMPSEIVGDDGLGFKVELHRDSMLEWRLLNSIQYYGFYDAGIVWNRDVVNLLPKQSATSVGVGARLMFLPHLMGNLYYAKPLTHSLQVQVLQGKDPFKPAFFFQLIATV